MDSETVVLRAIRRKTCVMAIYNQGEVLLAPHLLYVRHEQPHVAAITITRDGVPPNKEKLSSYRVSGLSAVRPTTVPFTARPELLADLSHPADKVLAGADRLEPE